MGFLPIPEFPFIEAYQKRTQGRGHICLSVPNAGIVSIEVAQRWEQSQTLRKCRWQGGTQRAECQRVQSSRVAIT
jgi:hypothetical protein